MRHFLTLQFNPSRPWKQFPMDALEADLQSRRTPICRPGFRQPHPPTLKPADLDFEPDRDYK